MAKKQEVTITKIPRDESGIMITDFSSGESIRTDTTNGVVTSQVYRGGGGSYNPEDVRKEQEARARTNELQRLKDEADRVQAEKEAQAKLKAAQELKARQEAEAKAQAEAKKRAEEQARQQQLILIRKQGGVQIGYGNQASIHYGNSFIPQLGMTANEYERKIKQEAIARGELNIRDINRVGFRGYLPEEQKIQQQSIKSDLFLSEKQQQNLANMQQFQKSYAPPKASDIRGEIQPAQPFLKRVQSYYKQDYQTTDNKVQSGLNTISAVITSNMDKQAQKDYKAGNTGAYYQLEARQNLISKAPYLAYGVPVLGETLMFFGGAERMVKGKTATERVLGGAEAFLGGFGLGVRGATALKNYEVSQAVKNPKINFLAEVQGNKAKIVAQSDIAGTKVVSISEQQLKDLKTLGKEITFYKKGDKVYANLNEVASIGERLGQAKKVNEKIVFNQDDILNTINKITTKTPTELSFIKSRGFSQAKATAEFSQAKMQRGGIFDLIDKTPIERIKYGQTDSSFIRNPQLRTTQFLSTSKATTPEGNIFSVLGSSSGRMRIYRKGDISYIFPKNANIRGFVRFGSGSGGEVSSSRAVLKNQKVVNALDLGSVEQGIKTQAQNLMVTSPKVNEQVFGSLLGSVKVNDIPTQIETRQSNLLTGMSIAPIQEEEQKQSITNLSSVSMIEKQQSKTKQTPSSLSMGIFDNTKLGTQESQSQSVSTISRTIEKTKPIQKSIPRSGFFYSFPEEIYPRQPPSGIPLIPPDLKKKKKLKDNRAYDSFVLIDSTKPNKRKWIQVADNQSYESALGYGAKFVDQSSLSSRFKVVEDKNAEPSPKENNLWGAIGYKFRNYMIRKGNQVQTSNQYLEKRKYRLDSPQEKRNIASAKASSFLIGGSFGNNNQQQRRKGFFKL